MRGDREARQGVKKVREGGGDGKGGMSLWKRNEEAE